MKQPTLIFIVADDLGFADLGCYGGREAGFGPVSPNLDALSAQGLKLTQGYANSPVCSPTRFALMTARYQYRLRGAAEEPINSKSKGSTTLGLPPEHPTLPSMLKTAGYHTALIGKWHLGYPPAFGPLKSGYDEFFGPMSGGVDYFTHCSNNGTHDLYLGDAEHAQEGYLTDLLSHRAVDYVRRMTGPEGQGKPFFLSLHYTAPHWPWETRADAAVAALAAYVGREDGPRKVTVDAQVSTMLSSLGRLVAGRSGGPLGVRQSSLPVGLLPQVPGMFQCLDGWVAVTVVFYPGFIAMTQRIAEWLVVEGELSPEVAALDLLKVSRELAAGEGDPAPINDLADALTRVCARKTKAEVVSISQERRFMAAPAMDAADVSAFDHYRQRGLFAQQEVLGQVIKVPVRFAQFDNYQIEVRHAAPTLSQHTEEVLGGLAGVSATELMALFAQGVI